VGGGFPVHGSLPPMKRALELLERRYAEIADLRHTVALLGWDQQVLCPESAAELRGHQLSTLAGVIHHKTVDPELGAALETLQRGTAKLRPEQRRMVELTAREVRKCAAVPAELASEQALIEARAQQAWIAARAADDFAHFAPHLASIVDLKREQARLSANGGPLYDPLLDDYEPGATVAEIDPLLEELRQVTVPLLERVRRSRSKVDSSPLRGRFPVEAQRAFVQQVIGAMGIDFGRARVDLSTHPFCGGVGPVDVRMTGRYDARDLRPGLYGAIHEAGHGLYEQGLDPKRVRNPLGGAISMAIHESQSRLWENSIARSRPFWRHFLPKARKHFGAALAGVTVDQIFRASNHLRPSLIRVEADELTYNLHIVLRYRLELELIDGRLAVRDLPERWNDEFESLLGFRPPTDREGCLQDIHWSSGAFGYFPTYALGNLYAAQFLEAAREALDDLDGSIAKGQFEPLAEWLRSNIHSRDRTLTAAQLVQRVTGKPLSVAPFARYITAKVEALYG
jgi:carboxypeptidase Taq